MLNRLKNWWKLFEANENHFAVLFVLAVVGFLTWLSIGNTELPIAELFGKSLQRLAQYAAFSMGFLYLFGGNRFDTVGWLKEKPEDVPSAIGRVAFALLAGAVILGASNVLGK